MTRQNTEQEPLSRGSTVYDALSEKGRTFLSNIKSNLKDIKESSFALILSIITGILAGVFLGKTEETLLLIPGLIVLVPAAMGMRGSIGGALGSRLSTALHLGTIDKLSLNDKVVRVNVFSSIMLSFFLSIFLAFVAKFMTGIFGLKSISLFSFIVISTVGGMLAGLILALMTVITAFAPIITALGDLFTIPCLLLAAFVVQSYGFYVDSLSLIILVVGLVSIWYILLRKEDAKKSKESYRAIIFQSVLILACVGLIEGVVGTLLESKIDVLTKLPILLVLFPVFLEEGGNIGNTLASRISTKLHLGTLDTDLRIGDEIKKEFFISYFLSLVVFPLTGLLVYAFSFAFGIQLIPIDKLIVITSMAGLVLTTVIIIATFLIALLSYKFGLDPDNTTIPVVTAVADILGVLSLLVVLGAFHIL
ncbi:MAG: magnesium transporter [Candidatus Aenigmarchaeota archaeon]|nr:magnesium transporter [Candidatus Aenigmarchaeota archaeon]